MYSLAATHIYIDHYLQRARLRRVTPGSVGHRSLIRETTTQRLTYEALNVRYDRQQQTRSHDSASTNPPAHSQLPRCGPETRGVTYKESGNGSTVEGNPTTQ